METRTLTRTAPLVPPQLILACSAVILISRCAYLVALASLSLAQQQMRDFGLFYYGLKSWQVGGSFYTPNQASYWMPPSTLLDLAPPHLHLVVWPLAWLPVEATFWTWLALNATAFLLSVRITLRELDIAPSPETVLPLLAFLLMTQPAHTFWLGQYDWLLMLPATLAWREIRNGRWHRGFALLGLVLSFKPFPLLFLAMAIGARQRRAALVMPAIAGAIAALGTLVFGWQSYVEWLVALRSGSTELGWMFDSLSLSSVWIRAFTVNPLFAPIADMPTVAGVGALVTAATVIALMWRRVRSADPDTAMALVWLTGFLVAPIAWSHYLALAFAPIFAVARKGNWMSRPMGWCIAASLTVHAAWVLSLPKSVWTTIVGGGWVCWIAVALWLLVWRETATTVQTVATR